MLIAQHSHARALETVWGQELRHVIANHQAVNSQLNLGQLRQVVVLRFRGPNAVVIPDLAAIPSRTFDRIVVVGLQVPCGAKVAHGALSESLAQVVLFLGQMRVIRARIRRQLVLFIERLGDLQRLRRGQAKDTETGLLQSSQRKSQWWIALFGLGHIRRDQGFLPGHIPCDLLKHSPVDHMAVVVQVRGVIWSNPARNESAVCMLELSPQHVIADRHKRLNGKVTRHQQAQKRGLHPANVNHIAVAF